MSSKGQVVIPESIRKRLDLKEGVQFLVLGEEDVVILKMVTPPDMNEFDTLIKQARKQAKEAGLMDLHIRSFKRGRQARFTWWFHRRFWMSIGVLEKS
jgi:AbrB family looped-hinge helix DNA binding protein